MQTEEKSGKINFVCVLDNLKTSLVEEDDIDSTHLLNGLDELMKLFPPLGIIFTLISKNLTQDLAILRSTLDEFSVAHLHKTVKTMIHHETRYDCLKTEENMSGCYTLLKIQQGLDFMLTFLKNISKLQNCDTISVACREAYDLTLSRDHSFIKRSAAKMAIYMLPTRENFFKTVCKDDGHVKQTLDILPEVITICEVVHKRIDTLYTVYEIPRHLKLIGLI